MKPSGEPVQQHSMKAGIKQYHAHFREDAGFPARQLANIGPDVVKHDVSFEGPHHACGARSVPNPHCTAKGSIGGVRKRKPRVRSPCGLGVPGQPNTGCEYYARAEMVLMAASRHSNLRACCRMAASSKLRVCACCMARARPFGSEGS